MTRTAKHTPGPWGRIVELGCDVYAISKDPESHTFVAECAIEEDARFIAAAPAMYEALKALHSVLDQRMPDGRTLNQHLSQEVFECFYGPAIAARAAIAKAEGA